ncbi:uncharacterized protein MONOS_2325 [Monocercomonoides exilis]|uniref:uncharacterized protein n=1 Tax=Monocercomonoides exilis TaxID=2049356 RepID=UPI0035599DB0|nr:hypothetical protein MONOS_2325 [Monocercomonoides exilis]|eukprot:MONOS_2325.1-p1 / transcript=MONOS_2325.1 / gene=MONOS_2325 / organism=Monocercomonoides_exilis_PA203 / gene_product=unspecified product / transcript_product=unspecified product / location=Mono_scaffold00047:127671-128138(+) / protein_length=156 / sequence_SO=supercontig / SO=protein_coding / is_pseudo=false
MVDEILFFQFFKMVVERASEKKIKIFFGKFEGMQSKKGEADISVFLGFLQNYCRAETATRKEVIKALYNVIFCCDISISSNSSSGAACRGISQDEMEFLQCVLSEYASCIATEDLLGCILIIWVLSAMICIWAKGAPALQLLHSVIAVAEYVPCS